jgi:hypothetical protein
MYDDETKESLARQRATREEGRQRREARKQEKALLSQARSTKEIREIKERFDNAQSIIEEGGIYDISTDTYEPTKGNEAGVETNLDKTGIHEASRDRVQDPSGGDSDTSDFFPERLDIVEPGNTAGSRLFLTRS